MSKYNVSAGAYQGSPPEDPSAALCGCFTERGNQMDGLGCILKYCQLDLGFKVGDTDLTGFRRCLDGFAGVMNKTKMYEMPRVHADSNIAQFVGQDRNDDLFLYIVQMNVHINSNTDTSTYILREYYAVNRDEMTRRAGELVAKVKEKLSLDDWISGVSSEGYGKAGSQVQKEAEP
ncbi:hypothetical protein BGZ74_003510 [Mortierella antarctica]|nr:hypothetical protein BGZ74_003510 [Mortierella antarctica]